MSARLGSVGRTASVGLALLLAASAGCKSPRFGAREAVLREPHPPVGQTTTATIDTGSGFDWIRLKSGEWLKGELLSLDDKSLEFDSDELDVLNFDREDVLELRSSRSFTILLDDREELIGSLLLLADKAVFTDESGTWEYAREDIFRMVPGRPREANYWSGKFSLSGTSRAGNTQQTDVTSAFSLLRRTARSRLPISAESAYGRLEGTENTNNHRLKSQFDWYFTPRTYFTPLGFELYRDPFQNIDTRFSPYTGIGYTLIDRSNVEWDGQLGLGYRWTRYDSVSPGEDGTENDAAGIVGSKFSWEMARDVDLDLEYSAQIGLENTSDTTQSASAAISVDLRWDLDLEVRLRWDRVGNPQVDDTGATPKKDDFRLSVGVGWSF